MRQKQMSPHRTKGDVTFEYAALCMNTALGGFFIYL